MRQRKFPFLLLMPLIVLTVLVLSGAAVCLVQSIGIIPSLGLTNPTLQYFADLLKGNGEGSSASLLDSAGISLYIAFASSLLSVSIGVLLCRAVISCKRAEGLMRQLLTVPIMLPHTVAALFTVFLCSQSGIFSRLLYIMGVIPDQDAFPALLYDEGSIGIIMAYLWKGIPFVCYFVLPSMKGIDPALYEAAYSMGATKWKSFFRITLPICLPAILGALFILLSYNFGAYELPFLLGATSPKALPVQAYIEYTHPDLLHRPYAMAMNAVMLLISLVFAVLWWKSYSFACKRTGGRQQ
ncbi:MAG: ABC transporter permease [Anaerovoracaceae bacterium]